jgi:hypothetical protein
VKIVFVSDAAGRAAYVYNSATAGTHERSNKHAVGSRFVLLRREKRDCRGGWGDTFLLMDASAGNVTDLSSFIFSLQA